MAMANCNICDKIVFENDAKSVRGILFHKDCFNKVYRQNRMCMWCFRLILSDQKCVYASVKGRPVNYHALCVLQQHMESDECAFCAVSENLCPTAVITMHLKENTENVEKRINDAKYETKKRDEAKENNMVEFKDEESETDAEMTDITSGELLEIETNSKKEVKMEKYNEPPPISGIDSNVELFQWEFLLKSKKIFVVGAGLIIFVIGLILYFL